VMPIPNGGKRMYQCRFCSRLLSSSSNRTRHEREQHQCSSIPAARGGRRTKGQKRGAAEAQLDAAHDQDGEPGATSFESTVTAEDGAQPNPNTGAAAVVAAAGEGEAHAIKTMDVEPHAVAAAVDVEGEPSACSSQDESSEGTSSSS